MPTVDTFVGNLEVPVPAGDTDAGIPDPTVDGLLPYLAFWTQYTLNAKLATMTAPPVPDACPPANQYARNPSKLVARFNRPALFLWWNGKSVVKPFTTIKDVRTRDLNALYVFDRIASDTTAGADAIDRYRGLISTVEAAWVRAISRRAHPGYAPPGAPGGGNWPAGTPIAIALGLNDLNYLGGTEGWLAEFPTASARESAVQTGPTRLKRGLTQGMLQGYPSLLGVFRVVEEVGVDQAVPADTAAELFLMPSVGTDPTNTLPLDDRFFGVDAIDTDPDDLDDD